MLAFLVQYTEKKATIKSDTENLKGITGLMKSANSFASHHFFFFSLKCNLIPKFLLSEDLIDHKP